MESQEPVNHNQQNTEKSSASERDQIKEKFSQFVNNTTKGCGRFKCKNDFCASNPSFNAFHSSEQAVAEGLKKVKDKSILEMFLCKQRIEPKPISIAEIEIIYATSNSEEDYTQWNQALKDYFTQENILKLMFVMNENDLNSNQGTLEQEYAPSTLADEMDSNVDIEAVKNFYSLLNAEESEKEKSNSIFQESLNTLTKNIVEDSTYFNDLDGLRVLVILLFYPEILEDSCKQFRQLFTLISDKQKDILAQWLVDLVNEQDLIKYVQDCQTQLSLQLYSSDQFSEEDIYLNIEHICNIMSVLYKCNQISPKIANSEFIASILQQDEYISPKDEYHTYYENEKEKEKQQDAKHRFSFYYYPFLMDVNLKQQFLQIENQYTQAIQKNKQQQNLINSFTQGNLMQPFSLDFNLSIKVRRDNILIDTLNQIDTPNRNFKLPLKVIFEGEQGIDEGGVQKEFFILLVKQLFNLDFGMFIAMNKDQFYWFNGEYDEMPLNYELVGIILGLAIYNNVLLDIKFPEVVYKMLLKKPVTLEDLKELYPEKYTGLKHIQDYQGDDLEDSYITFQVGYHQYYEDRQVSLKENGENIIVNQQNKQEYIDLNVDWWLKKHIQKQYSAFQRGFNKVTGTSDFIKNLEPQELQSIIMGCEKLDFGELKKVTRYADGFTPNTPIIKWFWEILLSEFSEEQQKRFLLFVSGCDRAPVQGLAQIKLIIIKQVGDSDKLPSSSTCFNHFFLPDYSSREKLKEKLILAIQNAEGFGLL